MTTYGTGKTAAAQTVADITGLVTLGTGSKKAEPIDYRPRPSIVEPPSTASLPPPRSGQATTVAEADWPKDPDELEKQRKKFLAEKGDDYDPQFRLPEGAKRELPTFKDDRPGSVRLREERLRDSKVTKEMFAEAKRARTGSVDANGNPVRRYLTEPPVDYREPDPTAPTDITEKKKKSGGGFSLGSLWPF